MLTMQYRIVLPADYDMRIIRTRIAERGHLTDDFPHLAFKAYLYADRHEPYAAGRENAYAPFYLWHNSEGMNAFLGGAGFGAVIESFGRPAVRTWLAWQAQTAADLSIATYATHESVPIPAHATIADLREAEHAQLQADLDHGALAAISAFDPADWTAIRFRLWRDIVKVGEGVNLYQVGHVSQPSTKH
ncbi:DUF4865 family protein [Dyella monticola]|uniref:DUF4865 family protein n=1 Tax=Dyella monticola TaxID=1927958 RepID=A0A370WRV6_9GAMM|nr:DUF4865 family protein [Dyella monticola]RDS78831.1 DUF4865 family protein [Dyella monticola]